MVGGDFTMISIEEKTDHQIRLLGLQVLQKELGVGGLIRFLQQYDKGQGDYTKDRRQWQKNITVDDIVKEITEKS